MAFPSLTSVCLDRHLSDHRPILLKKIHSDFGPCPFRIYHSWLTREGFDDMVAQAWNSFSHSDSNKISIDKTLDSGTVSDEILLKRMELTCNLNAIKLSESKDFTQKAKVKWAIEGDENSKFFHAKVVKDTFKEHFAARFQQPSEYRFKINTRFPKRLSSEQKADLDSNITKDEIRKAVWNCGANKSPGPDGKKKQALMFKVDFAKAYDSVRWDYLLDVLQAFGFGSNWCKWIRGILSSSMASILINGSPTSEFPLLWASRFKTRSPYLISSTPMMLSLSGNDGSLWSSVIKAIYGPTLDLMRSTFLLLGVSILRENNKQNFYSSKRGEPLLDSSFRRPIRGGVRTATMAELRLLLYRFLSPTYQNRWVEITLGMMLHPLSIGILVFYIRLRPAQAYVGGRVLCCRPYISLYGCHLKGKFNGVLVAATGIDGNNSIFPVAYGVLESENTKSWTWFLNLLKEAIGTPNSLVISSDMQKELQVAISEVYPNVEHRECIRHLYSNL
ncbi:RNA-directed DNA polymerase, eukaryota [Tanacetum coccineum]